jgi:hypothetical protein
MNARWQNSIRRLIGLLFLWAISPNAFAEDAPKQPRIVDDWWQVAGDPDLGELTTKGQQPVDFGVWQAADGTWQLWSCIRGTKEPGKSRIFYRWEGAKLTDADWQPRGIAMRADPKLGETQGGLQAPHVISNEGLYWMFYGDWVNICSATSQDGRGFERRFLPDGKTGLFNEGPGQRPDNPSTIRTGGNNARDPMLIRIGGLWHCYYCACPSTPDGVKGAVYCRTSLDLMTWNESRLVSKGGRAGDGHVSAECPFVVESEAGQFYLFRTQHYGKNQQTSVYFSRDPMDFGVDQDEGHFVCTLPVAAPEIIKHEGQYYIAALLPSLKGIRIARLEWVAAKSVSEEEAAQVLKRDQKIRLWGHEWVAHTAYRGLDGQKPGITTVGSEVRFRAATGDFHPTFDPADGRKIRSELSCLTRCGKGEKLQASLTFAIPPGTPNPELQWRALFQIHSADIRTSQGVPLKGSPLFSMETLADEKSPTGEVLLIRGETSTGDGSAWPTLREFVRVPFKRGIAHHAVVEVIDSHGAPGGLIRVTLDGNAIVDQRDIPMGYAFVDLPILWGGRVQDKRSYCKLGIYAGNQRRPEDLELDVLIRDVSLTITPP